ncbi:MAG: DoxX family membrane protein [Akkermansiaceae bacterium]|nr:DoxX family membrane protein [Akkermansiaceae bacterium]
MNAPLPAIPRVCFGLFWIWAGASKLRDPALFSAAIRNYDLIGDPLVAAAALILPWLEVIAGACLVLNRLPRGGSGILWGLLAVFTLAIAVSWTRGLDIECGCFGLGDGSTVNYPLKLAQNTALLLLGAWIWLRAAPAIQESR